MKYTFSTHFLERLEERNISIEDVAALVYGEVDTIIVPSKTDEEIYLRLGFIRGKGLAVIVNRVTGVLVTVRRMRTNEERLF
ncbi:MAG TPA: hypothetical protein DF296_06910 [Candidatus Margulisbacteria bacterium]|nr:MAG: hypothetical protein A2X43_08950 [Candidatus Margulisbacteria bacterium GWD2_39_127]OGI11058.1 MAG: hypothetical protein A2X41_02085 [Candidatus Margulisbacteria bacterium GWE2_39_32]HAR62348.1 hypothetical protein [Candidatus Margulisiibacteriota bacterium]HCT84915.1 hypothetical protein [Candidatus Margulisiibacteriota bacterium]